MANNLKMYLTGKKIILSDLYFTGTEEDRTFMCKGGFGCMPFTGGKAIFGYFVKSKKQTRVEGYMIEKLVK